MAHPLLSLLGMTAGRRFTNRSRNLRRASTPQEEALWNQLRAKRFEGLKFRRQHEIGSFIVDFACCSLKLAIEVDGGVHLDQVAYDQRRDAYLRGLGWTVLRFENIDATSLLHLVLETIYERVESLRGRPSP